MKTASLVFCLFSSVLISQDSGTGAKVFSPSAPPSFDSGRRPFYYLARLAPDGREQRVPPPYLFPNNTKARLMVEPTQDGHLVVLVNDLAEPYFPRATKDEEDYVRKGENIKIDLQFDDKPGKTKFTVVLITGSERQDILNALHDRTTRARAVKLLTDYLGPGKNLVIPSDAPTPHSDIPGVIYDRFAVENR